MMPSEMAREGDRKEAGAGAMENRGEGTLSQKQILGPIRECYLPCGLGYSPTESSAPLHSGYSPETLSQQDFRIAADQGPLWKSFFAGLNGSVHGR